MRDLCSESDGGLLVLRLGFAGKLSKRPDAAVI